MEKLYEYKNKPDDFVQNSNVNIEICITDNHVPINLMSLTEKEVIKLLDLNLEMSKDNCICELILFYYRKQLIDYFIGDFIIKLWQNKNPQYQKFWTTDIDRLTFIVQQLFKVNINQITNTNDLIEFAISSVIETVHNKVYKYINICKEALETFTDSDNLEKYEQYLFSAKKLIMDIEFKNIHVNVLKYISKHCPP